VAGEQRVVLKQCAMAGVGIEDKLRVAQSLEHGVGVVRRHHGVVTAADHERGLGNGPQDGMLGVWRGAPGDHRVRLRIGHGTAVLGVSVRIPIFKAMIGNLLLVPCP
jgi:hypothetical protein